MTSYASVADVQNVWGGTLDDVRTQALLDMGTELINAWLGVVANLDPPPIECRVVNINQAVRMLSNPQGVKTEQLASYSTTYGDATAGLTLTDADKALLNNIPGATLTNVGVYDVATPRITETAPQQPDAPYVDPFYEPGLWHVRSAARRGRRVTRLTELPPGRVARYRR
jgi:hypothetical protein